MLKKVRDDHSEMRKEMRDSELTQDNNSIVHKMRISDERLDEATDPISGDSDRRIMTTICHIWSDEHPLRQFVVLQILVEHGEIFDLRKRLWVGDNAFEADQRTVP